MKRETASYREGILADALHVVAVVLQIDDVGVGIDHVGPIESLASAEGAPDARAGASWTHQGSLTVGRHRSVETPPTTWTVQSRMYIWAPTKFTRDIRTRARPRAEEAMPREEGGHFMACPRSPAAEERLGAGLGNEPAK